MEKAIKIAQKGGYETGEKSYFWGTQILYHTNDILLDPLFWQALGKALGWKKIHRDSQRDDCIFCDAGYPVKVNAKNGRCPNCNEWWGSQYEWLWQQHRYIDVIAEGGDTENFFTDLTSKNGR